MGELALTEGHQGHTVKAKGIHIGCNKNKILVILHSSKTHGCESMPQAIKISDTPIYCKKQRFFCPFQILWSFLNIRGRYDSADENFFVFTDRTPVKAVHMRAVLQRLLKNIGLDDTLYNTHSFRIGMTTEMFKAGCSIKQIKHIG